MIKITRDKKELTVTKGAYENFFKKLGFEVVGEKKEEKKAFVKEADFKEPNKQVKPENKKDV